MSKSIYLNQNTNEIYILEQPVPSFHKEAALYSVKKGKIFKLLPKYSKGILVYIGRV